VGEDLKGVIDYDLQFLCSSNAVDLDSSSTQREFRTAHMLSCMWFLVVFLSPSREFPVCYLDETAIASYQMISNPVFLWFDAISQRYWRRRQI